MLTPQPQPQAWTQAHPDDAGPRVIELHGEVDLSVVEQIRDDVHVAADRARRDGRGLVVDLEPLRFIDSQGLRMLHDIALRCAQDGVSLALSAPRGSVAGEVLVMSALEQVLPVLPSLDASRQALSGPGRP